jgi:hypothetical protein
MFGQNVKAIKCKKFIAYFKTKNSKKLTVMTKKGRKSSPTPNLWGKGSNLSGI